MTADEKLIEQIVRAVIKEMAASGNLSGDAIAGRVKESFASGRTEGSEPEVDIREDITSKEVKMTPLVDDPEDTKALERMMKTTTARIGVGCAGPRLKTKTLLALRADHAKARDAVMLDVRQEVIDELGLFTVQTLCHDKNEYLTRPDLGRKLNEEGAKKIRTECVRKPQVQLIVADGLSSTAINANIRNVLPVLRDGLEEKGIRLGTTFFVKYGRVGVEDHIAELLEAEVVCIFVGERPGLGSAESMSAYIAYNAKVGMPEARRTVVSNIHKDGITAVEAGAYLTDLIAQILEMKASGIELQN